MEDQDAKDINQMMSGTVEPTVKTPRKSKFVWVVLGCVVLGVGLGIVVYQQSIKSTVPKTTPKPTSITQQTSPITSPVTPEVSLVQPDSKTVSFPKAGKLRIYYKMPGWLSLGVELDDGVAEDSFVVPAGDPGTTMRVFDTGYELSKATTLTINSYLGSNSSQLSIGWIKPVANKCGANGFGLVDITADLAWATAQSQGEPIVSTQCWGDYSPNPNDTSSLDFNDYWIIWSYTPSSTSVSPSPSSVASSTPTPTPIPTASAISTPTPTPTLTPTPTPTPTLTPTPTPEASVRVVMPDTSEGTPVTGVFEVTVGTVSVGLILLILGLFGLLAL